MFFFWVDTQDFMLDRFGQTILHVANHIPPKPQLFRREKNKSKNNKRKFPFVVFAFLSQPTVVIQIERGGEPLLIFVVLSVPAKAY